MKYSVYFANLVFYKETVIRQPICKLQDKDDPFKNASLELQEPNSVMHIQLQYIIQVYLHFSILMPKCPSLIYEQLTNLLHQHFPSFCVKEMENIDKFDITLYYMQHIRQYNSIINHQTNTTLSTFVTVYEGAYTSFFQIF